MSRKATNEYIGIKRRAYAQAGRAKRIRILDDVCETTGDERKYANRLLTGSRKFREHKGRGKTYGDDVAEVLKRVWREAGCPCLLCDDWSDFRNFFCPCKMLVSKEKRPDGKGYKCTYDKPRTPYQRVLDEHVLTPEQEAALMAYKTRLSGMELYRRVVNRRQPAHKPHRGKKIECPVFGKPKTTKLSAECLFYLTNWACAIRGTETDRDGININEQRQSLNSPGISPSYVPHGIFPAIHTQPHGNKSRQERMLRAIFNNQPGRWGQPPKNLWFSFQQCRIKQKWYHANIDDAILV